MQRLGSQFSDSRQKVPLRGAGSSRVFGPPPPSLRVSLPPPLCCHAPFDCHCEVEVLHATHYKTCQNYTRACHYTRQHRPPWRWCHRAAHLYYRQLAMCCNPENEVSATEISRVWASQVRRQPPTAGLPPQLCHCLSPAKGASVPQPSSTAAQTGFCSACQHAAGAQWWGMASCTWPALSLCLLT